MWLYLFFIIYFFNIIYKQEWIDALNPMNQVQYSWEYTT